MSLHTGVELSVPLSGSDAIRRRRATRHFDSNRPVPDDLLSQILHLATLAPSGFNLQPWRFLVVRSKSNREKLRAASYGQPKIGEAPVVVIVLGYHTPQRSHLEAMVRMQIDLGAITSEIGRGMKVMAERAVDNAPSIEVWATRSTMLAAATMMIAAESLGVASAPMEGFESERVRAAFGIPNDHSVCCLVALGYPAEGHETKFPGRFGLSEVAYLEHFGQPWTLGEG